MRHPIERICATCIITNKTMKILLILFFTEFHPFTTNNYYIRNETGMRWFDEVTVYNEMVQRRKDGCWIAIAICDCKDTLCILLYFCWLFKKTYMIQFGINQHAVPFRLVPTKQTLRFRSEILIQLHSFQLQLIILVFWLWLWISINFQRNFHIFGYFSCMDLLELSVCLYVLCWFWIFLVRR